MFSVYGILTIAWSYTPYSILSRVVLHPNYYGIQVIVMTCCSTCVPGNMADTYKCISCKLYIARTFPVL